MSPRDDGDSDRPKKSWRDVDAQRNRSKHVSSDPKAGAKRERDNSSNARAALERAFSDGLVSKLVTEKLGAPAEKAQGIEQRPELLKKIRITEARADVNKLIDELLALSPELPADWEVLTRCLDHDREEVVRKAIEKMDALLARERPPRRASLAMRLQGLVADTGDDELRALAEGLRAKLG